MRRILSTSLLILSLICVPRGARAVVTTANCASHLSVLGVSADEARFWSRRARSRDAFYAISSALEMMMTAPADVWELIALTRLGDLPPLKPFVVEFGQLVRAQPGFSELEILMDAELGDLDTEVAGVMAIGRFGSAAARDWFSRLLGVPNRVFVIARVLAEFPGADYDVNRGFVLPKKPELVRLILARLRRRMAPDRSWRPLFSSSRLLTAQLIAQRILFYKNEKRAVTVDVEQMGEWVLDRVARRQDASPTAEPANVPAHWTVFYARLFDSIDAPNHRQKKGSYGITEGEYVMAGLLAASVRELFDSQIKACGEEKHWMTDDLVAGCLMSAYGDEMVSLEGGTRSLALMLDAVGLEIPPAASLRKNFGAALAYVLGDSLREYYPLSGRGQRDTDVVEPVHEPETAAAPTMPLRSTESPDLETASLAVPAGAEPADTLPRFSEIVADRVYQVTFARSHAKFSGSQRVRFTAAALERMAKHDEVEPDAWLEALRRGIALPHRQRGVKLLVFGIKRNGVTRLPAEIKLLLSNYRVTGDFCDETWTFSDLAKSH